MTMSQIYKQGITVFQVFKWRSANLGVIDPTDFWVFFVVWSHQSGSFTVVLFLLYSSIHIFLAVGAHSKVWHVQYCMYSTKIEVLASTEFI